MHRVRHDAHQLVRQLIEVDLVADMAVHNPFDFFLEPDAEEYPFEYAPLLKRDLEPFLQTESMTPLLAVPG